MGVLITAALIVGFISSNALDIFKWVQALNNRFLDRGKKLELEDLGNDKPNTKLLSQRDLEKLYLGDVF